MTGAERAAWVASMTPAERLAWVEQSVCEANERLEREAAIARCDRCPQPKAVRDDFLDFPNGLRVIHSTRHCENPDPGCTASVQLIVTSEPPEVGDRIAQHLVSRPDLEALGVTYLIPCYHEEPVPRFILSCRTPGIPTVLAAIQSLTVAEFRDES